MAAIGGGRGVEAEGGDRDRGAGEQSRIRRRQLQPGDRLWLNQKGLLDFTLCSCPEDVLPHVQNLRPWINIVAGGSKDKLHAEVLIRPESWCLKVLAKLY